LPRKHTRFDNIESDTKEYFDRCDELNTGQKDIVKPYTLSGLLCHLSITRSEFDRMLKSRAYAPILTKALAKIEAFIEENSLTGGLSVNAASNSLKYNFGWGEKQNRDEGEGPGKVIISLGEDAERIAK